jgi:hypothetical protein
MKNSPIDAPENGAMYWLAGLSAAGAATMIVYSSAPGFLEDVDGPRDVGILLPHCDIDRVHWAEAFLIGAVFVAVLVVDLRLINNGIDGDRGLTGRHGRQ